MAGYWGPLSKPCCWPCFGWAVVRMAGPSSMKSRRDSGATWRPVPCTRLSSDSRRRGCCHQTSVLDRKFAPEDPVVITDGSVGGPGPERGSGRCGYSVARLQVAAERTLMNPAMPPRWAEFVLRLHLAPRYRQTVSGDLQEYRERIHPERGQRRADLWYIGQVAGFTWRENRAWACLLGVRSSHELRSTGWHQQRIFMRGRRCRP